MQDVLGIFFAKTAPEEPSGRYMQRIYQPMELDRERSISYHRIVCFAFITLAVLVFSIYGDTYDCSWHFDDEANITDNPNLHLKELSWDSIRRTLCSDRNNPGNLYRPFAGLSFGLNYYFGGLNVFGYHLVNVSIHFLASLFLFLFIYHTLHLPSIRGRYGHNSYFIALLATVLWAVNPVQTQAVTYIVQRMASLAGMFYIMGMYFYLKARTQAKRGRKSLFFALCLCFSVMAFGSKENTLVLPVSIALYEILLLQGITKGTLKKNLRLILIVCGATLAFGLLYLWNREGSMLSFLGGYRNRPFTLYQRLLTEPRVLILYISLLLYPVPNRLNIAHSIQVSTSLFHPVWTVLSIVLIFGTIVYAIYIRGKRPLLSFCVLFFFLNHVIESTVLPLELIFEHRNYIPSMLFFLPIAVGFSNLLEFYAMKRTMAYIISGFIILLLIGLGHSTFIRNVIWKNEKSLWMDAVDKSPNLSRPYHNLGRYYQERGYKEEAILQYEKALEKRAFNRIDEKFITYYNLGKIYGDSKEFERALYFYEKAMEMNPEFPPLYNNMAAIMDREGKSRLAETYLMEAFRLDPRSPEVSFNLGFHYLRQGDPEKAIHYLEGLAGKEGFRDKALLYLGIAFKQKGQLGRALVYLLRAKKENPRYINVYLHLAEVYQMTGHHERARREVVYAVDLMRDKTTFEKISSELQGGNRSKNLNPRASVIVPLIRDVCLSKSKVLKQWSELISNQEGKPGGETEKR